MSTETQKPTIKFDRIPRELRKCKQWVLWRYEERGGKPTKVPRQANGEHAKVNDSLTWTSFKSAIAAYGKGGFDGIGFVFTEDDEFFGIDLDACRNPRTGDLSDWAMKIVESVNSYTEVSPSAFGVKIVAKGKLKGHRHVHKLKDVDSYGLKEPEIAIYDHSRFWCMTGDIIDGVPRTCQERQEELDELSAAMFPAKNRRNGVRTPSLRQRLIDDCARAPNGERSERDFALCARAVSEGWDKEGLWRDVETIGKFAESGREYFDRTWQSAEDHQEDGPSIMSAEGRTDSANAARLAGAFGDVIRWCDPWGKWLVWDRRRWRIDTDRRIDAIAKEVMTTLWDDVGRLVPNVDQRRANAMFAFARSSNSARGIRHALELAKSEPGIAIQPDAFDQDPWLLNVKNGTLNLRNGELRPHRRSDYITKIAPVEFSPDAKCPTWIRFLKRILDGDRKLHAYVQRLVGLTLSGSTQEHVLPFLYGTGANGKSTFVNTILALMGDEYAMKASTDLILSKRNDSHPTERADLFGKRFVACVEVQDGRRLAESLVKELTGGDRIRARRMREDFWEFAPTHTIWLAANHKPTIQGTDHGIWRRIKLIPFTVCIPDAEQDKSLPERLLKELPGILNWALAGCRRWQRDGLCEPAAVRFATGEYRGEMDVLGQFLERRCDVGDGLKVGASHLYREYRDWCEHAGERAETQAKFGAMLSERGIGKRRTKNGWLRTGIGLKDKIHESSTE